jgi:hypothetical protein
LTNDTAIRLAGLLSFALSANIPLGYLREAARRYSPRWFLLIHLSIPFIIVLRITLGFDWTFIPLTLLCAVAGQVIGGRIRRRGSK